MLGDGRIFERNGWMWVAYSKDGKEYRESAKSKDRADAEKLLRQRIKEKHASEVTGVTFATPKTRRTTVLELCQALRTDFTIRGKTNYQNFGNIRRVERDFGHYRAAAITPRLIDKYIEERLANGDKPASINRTTQILGQAYNLGITQKVITQRPNIRKLDESDNVRLGFPTEEELAAIIECLPVYLKDLTLWCARTGMRRGEAISLKWSMVHGDELQIPGSITKNGKARVIPIVDELVDLIERRQAARRIEDNGTVRLAEHIFHRSGHRIGRFRSMWMKACRKAGYPTRLFHDLRRFAIRSMVEAGVDRQVAMKWSGHTSEATFTRYRIVVVDDMRQGLVKTAQHRANKAKDQKVVAMGAAK